MIHPPLNSKYEIESWNSFDEGKMIDFNPTMVKLPDGRRICFFRREHIPPKVGNGSIWAVEIDQNLNPTKEPTRIITRGEDPRAVISGSRIYILYILPEINERGSVTGTSVALAEFFESSTGLIPIRHLLLPKYPTGQVEQSESVRGWEKNWVPFVISETELGIIYSHDPWIVLTIDTNPANKDLAFKSAFKKRGVFWANGSIRGGTPPLKLEGEGYLTIFHASCLIGSRKIYSAGALIFESKPPFNPLLITQDPLLLARYSTGVGRFGWKHQNTSVIFPLGAELIDENIGILLGIDDGEIGKITLPKDELRGRMSPISSADRSTLHNYRGKSIEIFEDPVLLVPPEVGGIAELAMIDMIRMISSRGRRMVDIGAHIGFYSVRLATNFKNIEAFEPARFQQRWLRKNIDFNRIKNITIHDCALGDRSKETNLHVFTQDGGMNSLAEDVAAKYKSQIEKYPCRVETLDSFDWKDVDFIKIDVEGLETQVIEGASATIAYCRPVILMEVWEEFDRRERIKALLDKLGYTLEFIFPSSPELAICLPIERRSNWKWFF